MLRSRWYFLLLPVFFVTHGLYENVGLIPFHELLILLGILIALSIGLCWIFRFVFKDAKKAALFTFLLMMISLFFGVVQDFAEHYLPHSFFSSLTFLSLLSFIVAVIFFFLIRRSKKNLQRISLYLNVLLLLYILIDVGSILYKVRSLEQNDIASAYKPIKVLPCDSCAKPPVYLIVLDEYAGTPSLKEYFDYDNRGFEDSLTTLGFHVVPQSNSNYYYTAFSMASMLSMDYVEGFKGHEGKGDDGYQRALSMIKNSAVIDHFIDEGYTIRNYSYFDFAGSPATYKNDYLPGRINIILNKTIYVRLLSQALKKIGAAQPIVFASGDWQEQYIRNNQDVMKRVLNEEGGNIPTFTYVHLMMPHEPFSFNSKGERMRKWLRATSSSFDEVDHAYLEYLIYTNKQVFEFVQQLKEKTNGNAVILLMSDHGYRGFERRGNMNLLYSNLNAVYLPRMKYDAWHTGTGNVNQFRILFSVLFNANLPLLQNEQVK